MTRSRVSSFDLTSDFAPAGDQVRAIEILSENIKNKVESQVLLGVTGSGKTFTMANVIQDFNRPTLIMTHNKTLAAQLYNEFKEFFPNNAVEYFVSYYDYYQPEAYVPRSDTYIEKATSINDDLDKMRLSATRSLFDREDVIIVSSVSCIYGLGSPEAYKGMILYLTEGMEKERNEILAKLVEIQYERNDLDFHRGKFRVRGDTIEIFPAYDDIGVRVELFGDEVESISYFDPLTGKKIDSLTKITIYPASHYVTRPEEMEETVRMIREELTETVKNFEYKNQILEAQRIQQRTEYDIEMLEETGTCSGVENYSRIMTRRKPGEAPPTLIDYFPPNSLLIIDESHVTLPQIRGMYRGDQARKKTLVEHGFRLPSALDNRPLKYEEFDGQIKQAIYVSATPGDYEVEKSEQRIIEQIIRPTGLLDPIIEVRPVLEQVDDMYGEILKRAEKNERVLITTLTKRMSEDLTEYYEDLGIRVKYLHSDITTIERTEIIRQLRLGEFDVLIGINLLREGLDIPEVSLIGVMDADKEGFLRSSRSLLQTIGRAARNENGMAILYADKITQSMKFTIDETMRRRKIQKEHNEKHGIVPKTIQKKISGTMVEEEIVEELVAEQKSKYQKKPKDFNKFIKNLEEEMLSAAKDLDFERAAQIRDEIANWKKADLEII